MEFMMERWHSAVTQRFSVRKYSAPPTDAEWAALEDMANMLSVNGARVALCREHKAFAPLFLGYGRIKGTDCFAALIVKDAPPYTAGYLGEALALECTAMGLGTCWLGMFNKKVVQEAVPLAEGESVRCILAIGTPGEPYAARPRKTLSRLTGLDQQSLQALPQWQQRALTCARMAPSAVNAQPWRFEVAEDSIRLMCTSANHGYGRLDFGIAMLHVELGAAHCGVAGDWTTESEDCAVFRPTVEEKEEEGESPDGLDSLEAGAYNEQTIEQQTAEQEE